MPLRRNHAPNAVTIQLLPAFDEVPKTEMAFIRLLQQFDANRKAILPYLTCLVLVRLIVAQALQWRDNLVHFFADRQSGQGICEGILL